MYRIDENSDFCPITKEIDGCGSKEYCDLDVFRAVAAKFRPEKPMPEFCEMDPNKKNNGVAELKWLSSMIACFLVYFKWWINISV
ncbi:hypothetical protein OESDEN_22980 [Oesophagostomum dentatum]|uniref:Uncharacterized protein n=1 Tax=Oesophagostomum dentatum TaxID=61180 RepID=A0A0B1S2D7_OESDE|nr:hypothetical protein OESDEN_22980 [Oesophagostomum dentatum]